MPKGVYLRNSTMMSGKYIRTPEYRKKISETIINLCKNNANHRIGKYLRTSEMNTGKYRRTPNMNTGKYTRTKKDGERISKISFALTRRGADSNFWRGGICKEPLSRILRKLSIYRQWRSDVFSRDSWTCKTCGKNGCYLIAHHIKSFTFIIRENNIKDALEATRCNALWNINNGVTLCEECHKLTDNFGHKGRKEGIE